MSSSGAAAADNCSETPYCWNQAGQERVGLETSLVQGLSVSQVGVLESSVVW